MKDFHGRIFISKQFLVRPRIYGPERQSGVQQVASYVIMKKMKMEKPFFVCQVKSLPIHLQKFDLGQAPPFSKTAFSKA